MIGAASVISPTDNKASGAIDALAAPHTSLLVGPLSGGVACRAQRVVGRELRPHEASHLTKSAPAPSDIFIVSGVSDVLVSGPPSRAGSERTIVIAAPRVLAEWDVS